LLNSHEGHDDENDENDKACNNTVKSECFTQVLQLGLKFGIFCIILNLSDLITSSALFTGAANEKLGFSAGGESVSSDKWVIAVVWGSIIWCLPLLFKFDLGINFLNRISIFILSFR
jgi:hypothetical protein